MYASLFVCTRVKIIGSLGKTLQQAVVQAVVSYIYYFSPFFSLSPSRNSYSGSQQALLPPPHYVLWVESRQQLCSTKRHVHTSHNGLSACSYLPVDNVSLAHVSGHLKLPHVL